MKVCELRLGNYILHNGEVMPVVQIERRYKTIFRLNDIDVDERIIQDYFQPIPLTPEWLERCGFERGIDKGVFVKDNFKIGVTDYAGGGSWVFYMDRHLSVHDISCLHQLQNLYFALTGEELTINNVNLQSTS